MTCWSCPGIGDYTARAVAAFAFGARAPVVDTNVRRVLSRAVRGVDEPGAGATGADRALMESLLPADPGRAARLSIAVMELGALRCTAARPQCERCPHRRRLRLARRRAAAGQPGDASAALARHRPAGPRADHGRPARPRRSRRIERRPFGRNGSRAARPVHRGARRRRSGAPGRPHATGAAGLTAARRTTRSRPPKAGATHGFTALPGAVNRTLIGLNLVYLACIALVPYPTSLLGNYAATRSRSRSSRW